MEKLAELPSAHPFLLILEVVGAIVFLIVAELLLPMLMHRYLGINQTVATFMVFGLFGIICAVAYRYHKRKQIATKSTTDKDT